MSQVSVLNSEPRTSPSALAPSTLPEWYPAWAKEMADLYFSGTTCVFVLHGNVHDLVRLADGDEHRYCGLTEFLATQVFGRWDIVLGYDRSRGRRAMSGQDADRLGAMCS